MSTATNYYTLLSQQSLAPRQPQWLLTGQITRERLLSSLQQLDPGGTTANPALWHWDYETTGVDAHEPDQHVVVLGVATELGCGALDTRYLTDDAVEALSQWMLDRRRLWVAYNLVFDAAWAYRYLGSQFPRLGGCSHLLFRLLTSEQHAGQKFDLGTAQETVLGWRGPGSAADQKQWLTDALDRHRLAKRDMSKLADLEPTEFLTYCAVDAEASRQLWNYLTSVISTNWNEYGHTVWDYHQRMQVPQIKRVIRAQFRGLLTDRVALQEHREALCEELRNVQILLEQDSPATPYVQQFNDRVWGEWEASRTRTKVVRARKSDCPWDHPDVWRLDAEWAGKLTGWEKREGGRFVRDEVVLVDKAPPKEFNWASSANLRWLLYECLYEHELRTEYDWRGNPKQIVVVTDDDGVAQELSLTAGGALPTSKDVLGVFGVVGSLLRRVSALEKELGYVDAYLAASARDGLIHVKLRPGGTSNGRVAGG